MLVLVSIRFAQIHRNLINRRVITIGKIDPSFESADELFHHSGEDVNNENGKWHLCKHW